MRMRRIGVGLKRRWKHALKVARGQVAKVDLYYWQPEGGAQNFGDYLSLILISRILALRGLDLSDAVPRYHLGRHTQRLLGVGSILHFAQEGDTVWGAGINGKIDADAHTCEQLDVRLVRGPLTAEFLRRRGVVVPDLYGDPALLAGHLLKDTLDGATGTPKDYIVIPNLNDLAHYQQAENVVSPLQHWKDICQQILSSRLVIASSLHGLVVAESFGIPACWLKSYAEHPFKYRDYYRGTGREDMAPAESIDDARALGGAPPPIVDQEALLATFPYDLWK